MTKIYPFINLKTSFQQSAAIDAANKRFNMKDNPELQNKEVDKLKYDLEKEKKQTTFLQSQLATVRSQMSKDLALIKDKESQIKGDFL